MGLPIDYLQSECASVSQQQSEFLNRVAACHAQLGIAPALLAQALAGECTQPLCPEATVLVSIGLDAFGREQRLHPQAAQAWRTLTREAEADGIALGLVSAYRGLDYQTELIRRKLEAGQALSSILKVSAAPGFSEHHTGYAVDVMALGSEPLEVEFEHSACFDWLQRRAGGFGFTLSYPRNNAAGIDYEPWHWCFSEAKEFDPSQGL